MKSETRLSTHLKKATADGWHLQTESERFVAQQKDLYKDEIGRVITLVLREASERAFTRELWMLDDRFLARIDALCDVMKMRATVYYGISRDANLSLLSELERYVKQLASGLDVLSAQLNEDVVTRASPPRYHRSIASVFDKIRDVETKLLER